ncbi:MAG: hypothetical protein L3J24_08300 [Xanthomonadales bacterium]|nr:hypothetical protein [Xanthomonadales bacterium]
MDELSVAGSTIISAESTTEMNFLELRVCGLMRSGNHAIIDWIINQHAGQPVCFLNNVKHGDNDPYIHYRQKVLYGIDEDISIEVLRSLPKQLLICSYEDREELESARLDFLNSATRLGMDAIRRRYLGRSQHFFDILIVRDPFNCFASRVKLLQTRGAMRGVKNLALILHNWKVTARAAIALEKYPEANKIVINFNRWVTDVDSRQQLSKRLLGTFSDESLLSVSSFGGGSSFQQDQQTVDTPVQSNILERWQLMAADRNYLRMICDPEVLVLSEKLFGELPGTRALVNAARNHMTSRELT